MRTIPAPALAALLMLALFEGTVFAAAHWPWVVDHARDILDVLGVLATVAAALLAWLAIRAIRRERRIDFELAQLAAIASALAHTDPSDPAMPRELEARVWLLPRGTLPTADAWVVDGDMHKVAAWREFTTKNPEASVAEWTRWAVFDEVAKATRERLDNR